MKFILHVSVYVLVIAMAACVEPFRPSLADNLDQILVVDGYLDAGLKSVDVKLTFAGALGEKISVVPNAFVRLEGKNGTTYPLSYSGNGKYSMANTAISASELYRLHITSESKEYYSEFVKPAPGVPVIDDLRWEVSNDRIRIFIDAHDPSGQAKYFYWDYEETWEFASSFPSFYKVDKGKIVRRPVSEYVGICWASARQPNILAVATDQLSSPVVRNFELAAIPFESVKLSRRYSILVTQKVLSDEAFKYWQNLKSTTESLGGLFDTMPSQVGGNVRSTTPGVQALGYFDGGRYVQQRIFISASELPAEVARRQPDAECSFFGLKVIPSRDIAKTPESTFIFDYDSSTDGWFTDHPDCFDCRLKGGTTSRPTFW